LGWIFKVYGVPIPILGDQFNGSSALKQFTDHPFLHVGDYANFFLVVPKGRFLMDIILYTMLTILEISVTIKS
jgi:hypothetical protein